jgi:hypothetical protein
MAITVNTAFSEFMKDIVNLDPDTTRNARDSRDNLLANIAEFDDKDDFFDLCESFNVHFGSFARRTKCRELDDIDLMIGIAANGASYFENDPWDNTRITASKTNSAQVACTSSNGTLNSTLVINKFKKKLENVREYQRSEINKRGEAVVLNLISKDWSFDIVPCFHTVEENDGRAYFLIPNGSGGWKKTDPTIDREAVSTANQNLDGRVLELIRIMKRWNKTKRANTIPSYLLEALMLDYCKTKTELSQYIDLRFKDALLYVVNNINWDVNDPKSIQGNINTLSAYDKLVLQKKAKEDYDKACEAASFETKDKDHQKSINKWGEIFGQDFPTYG